MNRLKLVGAGAFVVLGLLLFSSRLLAAEPAAPQGSQVPIADEEDSRWSRAVPNRRSRSS